MSSLLVSGFLVAVLAAISIGSLIAVSRSSNSSGGEGGSGGGGGGGGGGIGQPGTVIEKYSAALRNTFVPDPSLWTQPQLGAFVTGKSVSISAEIFWLVGSGYVNASLPLLFNLPFSGSQLIGEVTRIINLPSGITMEFYTASSVAFRLNPGNRLLVGSDVNPGVGQSFTIYLTYQKD